MCLHIGALKYYYSIRLAEDSNSPFFEGSATKERSTSHSGRECGLSHFVAELIVMGCCMRTSEHCAKSSSKAPPPSTSASAARDLQLLDRPDAQTWDHYTQHNRVISALDEYPCFDKTFILFRSRDTAQTSWAQARLRGVLVIPPLSK